MSDNTSLIDKESVKSRTLLNGSSYGIEVLREVDWRTIAIVADQLKPVPAIWGFRGIRIRNLLV